ncbi:galaxin-like isoform X2 [Simochromis diagramma]|uniref:galaxin-like isoform X2 n=1 Tax=Simochromis diagramma TaxID=43689 RepID=UPI001A7ECEF1|nr:galaxin-like isoform X2 [Simochromis diagramma]
MFSLWALGFVLLIFGITTVCEPAGSNNNCHRKDCNGTWYDIKEATCCENRLHPGASLSCCGNEPYSPGTATCCKQQHRHTVTARVTQGLSEKVSSCCELKAYNPVNEICCQSTIIAKPSPMAECCGKGVYDVEKELCCGPISDKKILTRNSPDHVCCHQGQFNSKAECCCWKDDGAEIQPRNSSCCMQQEVSVMFSKEGSY